MQSKKYRVVTLGCRTNQYESEAFSHQLRELGYTPAAEGEGADICIVNTCTVTESADSTSRYQIRSLARKNPDSKILVTGCLAERAKDELLAIEGVHSVIPNAEKEQLLKVLFPDQELPEFKITQFESHTRAFVKVQDGCNSYCTYCILPYVRGRSKSRRVDEIVREIEGLIQAGYKEVVITGINVGDFDGNPHEGESKVRLSDLVRIVDQIDGLKRLRVSSIDPDEVDDDFMDAIISGKNTCHSLHLVLQSGSNAILKRMNRKYTRQIFFSSVEKLRAASPDFTFTTDVIVGFPGESEADFAQTMEVIEEVQFAKVHMFPYSERPKTRAALYPGKIDPKEIDKRRQAVLRLAENARFQLQERFIGRQFEVLFENEHDSDQSFGHTSNFLPVIVPNVKIAPHQLALIEIIGNSPKGLIGKVVI